MATVTTLIVLAVLKILKPVTIEASYADLRLENIVIGEPSRSFSAISFGREPIRQDCA